MPYWNLLLLVSALALGSASPKVLVSGRNVEMPLREVFGNAFRLKQLAAKLVYWRADGYVAISHPVAAEAAALYGIRGRKISVIPNPAAAKLQSGNPEKSYGGDVSSKELHIVVPARIVKQKRPTVPLQVAKILATEGFECTVHYFGEGDQQNAVAERAAELDVKVEFHGWVENWFSDAPTGSVVLLASLSEGFGNVLVEAAGSGFQSVVSSRCLGSADAIVPGLTGELVRGDSPSEYAAGVRIARLRGSVRNAEAWLTRFTPDNSGSLLLAAITEVIENPLE